MKVLLTGLNHRTAPVEVRERFAIPDDALAGALKSLREQPGIHEALILSTCNRVEITVSSDDAAHIATTVRDFIAGARHLDPNSVEPYLYRFEGDDAIRHLFRVASSLDSMVLGEPQILGQMKAAYAAAREQGAVNGFLESVLSRAFSVAKRVRTETGIGRNAVSVSYAAIELARQIFGNLKNHRVLLIGAGKMSELAARHLRRAGCGQILVTNRTRARAEEVAVLVEGAVIDYEAFPQRLHEMDIVLCSSGAPDFVLRVGDLRRALDARRHRPMFLIDIAVPRNIEPASSKLEGVFLYDIDDLGRAVQQNRETRQKEAEQAEQLIEDEVRRLAERLRVREAGPTIALLQQHLESLAISELDRVRGKLGDLSPAQQQTLELYARSLMHKIAHGPITELRRAAAHEHGSETATLIRRLFRLEE